MIEENRLKHILGVARQVRRLALKLRPKDNMFSQDMFVVGFLHDFGYEFDEDKRPHALIAGEILKRLNFKYCEAVENHGNVNVDMMSDELFLLNCADMTVKGDGTLVTTDERLADIGSRYGKESAIYQKAVLEIDILKTDPRFAVLGIK